MKKRSKSNGSNGVALPASASPATVPLNPEQLMELSKLTQDLVQSRQDHSDIDRALAILEEKRHSMRLAITAKINAIEAFSRQTAATLGVDLAAGFVLDTQAGAFRQRVLGEKMERIG